MTIQKNNLNEVGEYQFEWVIISKLRHNSGNHSKSFEVFFKNEKISMIVDFFVSALSKKHEKTRWKLNPLVTFQEAPKNCRFEFVITTAFGGVINFIEECKMEANKGYSTKPDRFVDSKNFKHCTNPNEAKFFIHLTVKQKPKVLEGATKSIAQDMQKLFENKNFSDFTFNVEGEEMKVHKAILAARSPEFRKIFTENSQESSFTVADISKEVFEDFLRFAYSGSLQHLERNAMELMKAADHFGMLNLKQICESQLVADMPNDKANAMFQLAHKFDLEQLKRVAFEMIQQTFANARKVIPGKFINEPKKVEKLVDMMKAIDDMIEIENVTYNVVDDSSDEGITDDIKRVKFSEENEVKIFENENSEEDDSDDDDITVYLNTEFDDDETESSSSDESEDERKQKPLVDALNKFDEECAAN